MSYKETYAEIQMLTELMFQQFKSLTVTPETTAELLNRSEVSLARDRAHGLGLPYTKLGKNSGSDRVLYNIHDIATFLASRKSKV